MVNFLDGLPLGRSRRCARSLQRLERLHLEADHLCVDYAEGVARSRLTPAFLDKALQVPATGRNWNTTNKMLDTGRGHSKPRPVRAYSWAAAAQAGLERV
jgi:uncharacterized protein (DUF1697 family)